MKKIKVGLLTMSDGREHLHREYLPITMKYQQEIIEELEKSGKYEVIAASEPLYTNEAARREAMRLREANVEVTMINYSIWCYPQFTAVATAIAPGPFLLFCNLHPSQCGMVGMLAAAGTLDQLERPYGRIWGSIRDEAVFKKVDSFLRAASAVTRMRGMTFGNFGGRPLGMYTAVANLDQWQKLFGIDVENIEQEDIVRAGLTADADEVEKGLKWIEDNALKVGYNGKNLTPDILRTQIRSYLGLKKIIEERHLDFVGIKAHGDLTEHYCTMDVAEAFLNDPYDWNGRKESIVAATEADMDGALTMQMFKLITGKPVLFCDVRHYDFENDVWFFSNSGTHATYFAAASEIPEENLRLTSFLPETVDYPAGGASVHHFAAPGKFTFARLARKGEKYVLTIVPAELIQFDRDKMEALGQLTTPQWPIAFARLNVSADHFLSNFPCNHIHGVYGDHVQELMDLAKLLKLDVELMEG